VADKEGENLDSGDLNLPDDDLAKDDSVADDLAEMDELGVPEGSDDAEAAPLDDEEAEVAPLGDEAAEVASVDDEADVAPVDDAEDLPVLESDEASAGLEDLGESDADESEEEGEEGEEEEEEEEKPGFLAKLRQASPFTVMLGLSVVAILIAILCLVAQLKEYGFETRPPKTGMPAATAPASQFASANAAVDPGASG